MSDSVTPWTAAHQAPLPQARVVEWVAMASSRGSSRPRDQTCVELEGLREREGVTEAQNNGAEPEGPVSPDSPQKLNSHRGYACQSPCVTSLLFN